MIRKAAKPTQRQYRAHDFPMRSEMPDRAGISNATVSFSLDAISQQRPGVTAQIEVALFSKGYRHHQ